MNNPQRPYNVSDVISSMYETLCRKIGISAADWEVMKNYLRVVQVPAKYCLQNIGEPVKYHYFMTSGLVRLYYITSDGKDINKGFYSEGAIAGNLSGLILGEPSRFGIDTIESSVLVELDLSNFETLMATCPGWATMFHYSCERMLIRNERREAELLTMSAQERYLQFCKNFKHEIERIPQYHIASYLGITPVALSRYKKQWLAIS